METKELCELAGLLSTENFQDKHPEYALQWLKDHPYPADGSYSRPVDALKEISKNIATQDNRITADPIFLVQQKRRDYGYDPAYSDDYIWIDDEASEEVFDEELIAKLEASNDEEVDGLSYHKVYYKDRWEFVTACFTEAGCEDFIRRNGHRMKEPRVYVDTAYRNEEFLLVRNFLIGLAAVESTKRDAPVKHYRCAACGEDFNEPLRSHTRAVMGKDGNPEPMECGPIFEYAFEYAPVKPKVTMRELRDNIIPACSCDEAYGGRNLDDPTCPQHGSGCTEEVIIDFLRAHGVEVVEDKEPR